MRIECCIPLVYRTLFSLQRIWCHWPAVLQADTDWLQIHWPGLQQQQIWEILCQVLSKAQWTQNAIYSGHLFSLLWHVWTWPHLRVGILLYMGDGVKGLVKGGQLDVGWLECGLCPVRCVGDLLPTWVGPRFKYLVAAYYFDWWGWLYVQDAACNVLSIGGLHCGGFSLDSGVGWEGSLLLRTLSFDERVWGEVFAG